MCKDCLGTTPKSYIYQQAPSCNDNNTGGIDARDVIYNSVNLPCANVSTGDSLKDALQKIDSKLCQVSGDYSTYNIGCLAKDGTITTEGQFVSRITSKVCSIDNNLNNFLDSTFPAYQAQVTEDIINANKPYLTCTAAGVQSNDNTATILSKYCSAISSIKNSIDVSGINWTQCFSVGTAPTNIKEAFALVEQQICLIKQTGASGILPTFNNAGSCLPGPTTSNDSLYDTVEKIKTRLCQTPTFSITKTWGCVLQPSTITLDNTIQAILNKTSDNSKAAINQVEGASLSFIDPNNPCLGKKLIITGATNTDRLVAASATDTTPGTLADKLQAGSGVNIDTATNAAKAIISTDGTVAVTSNDSTHGYLENKIKGSTSNEVEVTTTTVTVGGVDHIEISASIDIAQFLNKLTIALNATPELKDQFCALISSCGISQTVYSNIYAAGPPNTTIAVQNVTLFSDSNIEEQPFRLGARVYVDANLTSPAYPGRYYRYNSLTSEWDYCEVDEEVIVSTTVESTATLGQINSICTVYRMDPTGETCDWDRSDFNTKIYFNGLLGVGTEVYLGYMFSTHVSDGTYWYLNSGFETGSPISSFNIVGGAITEFSANCGVVVNTLKPASRCFIASPTP